MKTLCVLFAFFCGGCSLHGSETASPLGFEVGLRNRLLQEQIEAYSKTLQATKQQALLTVSVRNLDDANEFVISSTINDPRQSADKVIAYDVINGYLVVFSIQNMDLFDTQRARDALQAKIQEMGIKLSDKFLLYEARMCIIKMDYRNSKILSKECN